MKKWKKFSSLVLLPSSSTVDFGVNANGLVHKFLNQTVHNVGEPVLIHYKYVCKFTKKLDACRGGYGLGWFALERNLDFLKWMYDPNWTNPITFRLVQVRSLGLIFNNKNYQKNIYIKKGKIKNKEMWKIKHIMKNKHHTVFL